VAGAPSLPIRRRRSPIRPPAPPPAEWAFRVVDEDGAPLRRGVLQVLRPEVELGGEEFRRGEAQAVGSEKRLLFKADLASFNPASYRPGEDAFDRSLVLRVRADGLPHLDVRDFELRPEETEVVIVLPSRSSVAQ
jgi:hypothetical protein